ncbi:MAG: tRNA uridine-5-carboxymethylaminomethyl(34) synthesis GTPase MnmE [Hyphomicrobiaceae bacterium]|nr:tRNA uridine-5-carboxymethylaminomethyl(34) synthesis GTPase MnmE [Hyphomicrobiaceae bacterium]
MTSEPPQSATIYALSSAPGRAGVAIVRVSGSHAGMVLNVMTPQRPKPRVAGGRRILHPKTGEVLDRGIVLWFPHPNSFTGEDVAELQLHGGRAVVAAVLEALGEIPGLRMAEPGEFARRAFDNGKIDLAQAEGLADLIDAETEGQRRQALRQASGALSSLYESWRTALIDASALVEAAIDFSDEGDVGARSFDQARGIVETLLPAIRHHLDDGHRGEILRDGFHVVLAGAPNVGKSSLLNALARREAAIVSEEAGTTRDVIEVRLDLGGVPVIVSDTAGIRETSGAVEREGIRRTMARAREADLVIWLTDPTDPQHTPPEDLRDLADRTLLVLNKADQLAPKPVSHPGEGGQLPLGLDNADQAAGDSAGAPAGSANGVLLPDDMIAISALTGAGISSLVARIGGIARERVGNLDEPAITQVRHRRMIEMTARGLETFLREPPYQVEIRAEDLRASVAALGRITGRVDVEDVLDQVFGRFCIGK